uniref:Protein kinase domain-containing protein n=1 Tax=Biomphalaria glabrata TaxID=6526 RepID=A0A2C9LNR0_BIOGL
MSVEEIENLSQMEVIYNFKMKSPGSILCSDMSLEDTNNEIQTNVMPKRVIVDATYMGQIDQENESSSQKEDYDNCIIDKKAYVSGAKDFKQTCSTFNLPFRQKDCWRPKTVHCSNNYEDELHRQLNNLHEQREIKPFDYSFNKQMYSGCQNIGPIKEKERKGGFGKVYLYKDIQTGWRLAVKKVEEVKNKHLQVNEVEVPIHFPNEINIARVLGCFFDGLDFYIIQEHAGKSLLEANKDEFNMFRTPNKSLTFAFQLFTGLNVLSQHGITHCDVKPHNVCFSKTHDGSFLVKLIDFGSCQTKKDPASCSGSTPEYLPPDFNKAYFNTRLACHRDERACTEHLRSLNEKDDIWAAGLTLLYIYKENHPMLQYFDEQLAKFKEKNEKRKENIRLIGGLTDPLSDYFTTRCAALDNILRCILVVNSDLRWTASPILAYLQDQLDRSFMATAMSEPCDDFIDIKKGNGQREPIISDIGNTPVEDGAQYFGLIMKSKKKYYADKISDKARTTRQNHPEVGKNSHCAVQETNQQEAMMEYSLQREQFVFPSYQPQYQSEHQPSNQSSSPIRECLPVTQARAVKENNIPRFDLLLGDSNLC